MNGLDEVGMTMARDNAISAFEAHMKADRPWL
jgi:3-isopropylmalate/(R)-2-methylmalate dehydratase small subunit